MKKILLSLLIFSALFPVYAKDPFDKTQRNLSLQNKPSFSQNTCSLKGIKLAESIPFQQLQLVGIMKYQNRPQAIFVDQAQQVSIGEIDNLIAQEQLKITEISPQQVKLFDCQQAQFLYIKF